VTFVFGIDATANLYEEAESLPKTEWKVLNRQADSQENPPPRARPLNVKQQLGLHGYRFLGLESQGLVCTSTTRSWSLARKAYRGEAATVAYGLFHLSQCPHQCTDTDCAHRQKNCLSLSCLESVAECVLSFVQSPQDDRALVADVTTKPESGCSGPPPLSTAIGKKEHHHRKHKILESQSLSNMRDVPGTPKNRPRKIAEITRGLRLIKD